MIVYDVTDEDSFETMSSWMDDVFRVRRMQNTAEGLPCGAVALTSEALSVFCLTSHIL